MINYLENIYISIFLICWLFGVNIEVLRDISKVTLPLYHIYIYDTVSLVVDRTRLLSVGAKHAVMLSKFHADSQRDARYFRGTSLTRGNSLEFCRMCKQLDKCGNNMFSVKQ